MIADFFERRPGLVTSPRHGAPHVDQAYPGISIRPGSRRLWARLMRWPAECIHLESGHHWMATFIPDTLYLRGKAGLRRKPARPEVWSVNDCLAGLLEAELATYPSRVVAFEPDGENFTQYFFLGTEDFAAAGLRSEVAAAILTRLEEMEGACSDCGDRLPGVDSAAGSFQPGPDGADSRFARGPICAKHGAAKLCSALGQLGEANLFT